MPQRGRLTLRREDGRVIAEEVVVADTMWSRMRGLLGRRSLNPGSGIVLRPAFSIHTAFMRFPIDVVFLDPDLVVVRLDRALKSFRTASYRGAREIVELAAGECERRGLDVGDRVTWAPTSSLEEAPGRDSGPAESRGAVLLVTSDGRFARLTQFLLTGKGFGVLATVFPDQALEALEDEHADVVVFDAKDDLNWAMTTVGSMQFASPETRFVVVGEPTVVERAPATFPILDKWNATDAMLNAVEEALPDQH